jgi:uncharacterized protein YaaN involved in tellurite resistance
MEEHRGMGDSLKIGLPAAAKPAGIVAALEEAESVRSSVGLVPPAPAALVEEPEALGALKLEGPTLAKLDAMVADFVVAIIQLEVRDPKFRQRVADIQKLGDEDIKVSAETSSRLLARPVNTIKKGSLSNSSAVGSNLIQLRRQIDALDPGRQGDLFGPRKLLGLISLGDKLQTYLARYQSSQSHLNAILAGLESGRQALATDNDDLAEEEANLWQTIERLRQYIYLAGKLDSSLEARIARVEANDPDRARILKEDMLFYVRQKVQDLTSQLAVSVQGFLAIDIIRRNNSELMRGVGRAATTTISALRTAVIVTGALGDQRLVLDQITALNMTTSNMIQGTSTMLRNQTTTVGQLAGAPVIDVGKLQAAFDNVYAALDELDTYKLKTLDTMSRTVDAMTTQISRAQPYLDRARAREEAAGGRGAAGRR